jgi:hypothetical protein
MGNGRGMAMSFPEAWLSVALKGYRDHPKPYRAYSPFTFGSLPPLPEASFDSSFSWLPRTHDVVPTGKSRFEWAYPAVLERIAKESERLQITIPESFKTFMLSVDFPNRIRSATGCAFDLAERLVYVPWEAGYLLRFLADSQGCLFWYLFLKQRGGHCVVVTAKCYGGDPTADREFMEAHLGPDWNREDPPKESDRIRMCAPSFESFVYRFWIENEIWYALNETGGPINDEQKRYLRHYREFAD